MGGCRGVRVTVISLDIRIFRSVVWRSASATASSGSISWSEALLARRVACIRQSDNQRKFNLSVELLGETARATREMTNRRIGHNERW